MFDGFVDPYFCTFQCFLGVFFLLFLLEARLRQTIAIPFFSSLESFAVSESGFDSTQFGRGRVRVML